MLVATNAGGRSELIVQPHPQSRPQSLPPEPVRYLGADGVRIAVNRKNAAEIRDLEPDLVTEPSSP